MENKLKELRNQVFEHLEFEGFGDAKIKIKGDSLEFKVILDPETLGNFISASFDHFYLITTSVKSKENEDGDIVYTIIAHPSH